MASKSKVPSAFSNAELVPLGHSSYLPEPPLEEEKLAIWKSQVLIPFSLGSKPHAFLGPFVPQSSVESSFSADGVLAFSSKYNLDSLENAQKVFRTMPPVTKDLYLPWLDRVEGEKQDSWRAIGIYDVIQLSRYNVSYNFPMIMSSLFFWDRATSSFHVPCGMITPTLFDVAAILGLRPAGPSFRPDSHPKNPDVTPNFQKLSYQLFITLNMNRDGPVTDEEHVVFMMFWLSAYVFCSRSLQVPKTLLTLAQLLHEESSICLGKLILGNLYENLNEAVASFRSNDFPSVISGPFWLLQLWLNAIFEEKLQSSEPPNTSREIEGFRLTFLTTNIAKKHYYNAFRQYFNFFLSLQSFTPQLAPFSARKVGQVWFKRPFPSRTPSAQSEVLMTWRQFLSCQLLFCSFTHRPYQVVAYQPNLVARQFGLGQLKPSFMLEGSNLDILENARKSIDDLNKAISFFRKRRSEISPLKFEPIFYCTSTFQSWWSTYYHHPEISIEACN
ncbi:uncharacterized protein LOC113858193 [Abrus precatorius]|uniref:Uncharacterized protein LOC113858193 n=1 Tax=Abrus precatorius TaxID=3816 RepID=A0A8B8KVF2_ABRPR|nr:uncharacterized protein LOC113858193 [Abrus precatorius]